jgi:alkylation response protein AidB-like acyl-CoA dehydrogenase
VRFSPEDEEFRTRVREWLAANVSGDLHGAGGPGREHESFEARLGWNRRLAAAGWTCLGWPVAAGGSGLTIERQVIFHEEYARAQAPARVAVVGEELAGPMIAAFGTDEQKQRFLPPIRNVTELWCQGFSEPGAGSDLASVTTSAHRDGDDWVITGQKIWTSLAHVADWCFVLARTAPGSKRSAGLSMLLVPMHQPAITVRPITQLTGTSEFNEVFFDGARTGAGNIVGALDDGWRVVRGTLAIERGVAMLGQQVAFRRELDALSAQAPSDDPLVQDQLARARAGLEAIRAYALDTLGSTSETAPSVLKILWSRWHRDLGELAMRIRGASTMLAPGGYDQWQRMYLFSRADTIYGGSDEIQHGIIAQRALGLPRPLNPLDDARGRQRAAGAHGDQGQVRVAPLQLVQGGGQQPGAGRADRVAERDRAAVDVDPVLVRLVHPHPGQRDRRERLVHLEQVDVGDRHARPLEHPRGRLHGAVQVVVGLGADQALRHDASAGPQPELVTALGRGQQQGGRAVGDLRRGPGRVQAAFHDGLQAGQGRQAGLAQPLVPADAGDRDDLAVEVARRPGAGRAFLRAQPELVGLRPGDVAPGRDALGPHVLVGQVDGP